LGVCGQTSNQNQTQPDLAKLEYQSESMAVTIVHAGIIRYVAIHTQRYKGYAYWWNNGTLQEMLNVDNRYGENISLYMAYENM
jgi:hypothetical protein